MEREAWSILMVARHELGRSRRDTTHQTHPTMLIVRVFLWAALHDRPTSWACDPRAWDDRTRPRVLPSQPTMSRRLRTDAATEWLDALTRRLRGTLDVTRLVAHRVDGKPLPVAKHARDRDATPGDGAGQPRRGFKLHVADAGGVLRGA